MSKIVIALGGNALGKTPDEQKLLVKKAANIIVSIAKDNDVIVTHGNGPQVGMIANAFEYASKFNVAPFMPFAECGAMSQGYIGYHLQNAINEKLREKERITCDKKILSEEKLEELNGKMMSINKGDYVKVVYYNYDSYEEFEGIITNIDYVNKNIKFNTLKISFYDIYDIERNL